MHMLPVLWTEARTPAALRGCDDELIACALCRTSIAGCLPSWLVIAANGFN